MVLKLSDLIVTSYMLFAFSRCMFDCPLLKSFHAMCHVLLCLYFLYLIVCFPGSVYILGVAYLTTSTACPTICLTLPGLSCVFAILALIAFVWILSVLSHFCHFLICFSYLCLWHQNLYFSSFLELQFMTPSLPHFASQCYLLACYITGI